MMDTIIEFVQDNQFEAIVTAIFTFIVLSIAFAWSRRRMAGITETWVTVAEAHSLQYASNPVSYDYGDFIGERTWDYPGMMGTYRGRQVQVQTMAGTQGREAGRFILIATLQLQQNVPFSALAYKRKFSDIIRERAKKDSKSNYKPLDNAFKLRSENVEFLVNLSQKIDLAEGLKAQKFRTAQIVFDERWLAFEGATADYNAKPEDAIALLDWLCELADKVDSNPL